MSGVRLHDGPDLKQFVLVGWDRRFYVCCLEYRGSTSDSLLLQILNGVAWQSRDLQLLVESMSFIIFGIFLNWFKINRKAMNRNWSNQTEPNPALKTKTGNK